MDGLQQASSLIKEFLIVIFERHVIHMSKPLRSTLSLYFHEEACPLLLSRAFINFN